MNQDLSNKIHFAYKIIDLFFMNLLINNLLSNLIGDNFCKTCPSKNFNIPHKKKHIYIFIVKIYSIHFYIIYALKLAITCWMHGSLFKLRVEGKMVIWLGQETSWSPSEIGVAKVKDGVEGKIKERAMYLYRIFLLFIFIDMYYIIKIQLI